MKIIALLFGVLAVASGLEWTDLRSKWNTYLLDPFRLNSFFEIPRTLDDAVSASWVKVTGLSSLNVTTYCYPNDGQLCLLFDTYGYIAGFQAGILRSDVDPTGNIYNTSQFDVYQNKTIFDEEYVTSTVLTVDPDVIAAGGRSDWDELTGTEGVWFETTDGYIEIPRNVTNLDSLWIAEACISEMGTHYYYNMTTTSDCAYFYPWFLLYQDGVLSGVGLQAFGSCTIKSRSWCEWVPSLAIRPTIPTCPDCLVTWVADYGTISRHFYFTSEPWDISC